MDSDRTKQLKILCCGAGMQSTALALMSCENAKTVFNIRWSRFMMPLFSVIYVPKHPGYIDR